MTLEQSQGKNIRERPYVFLAIIRMVLSWVQVKTRGLSVNKPQARKPGNTSWCEM